MTQEMIRNLFFNVTLLLTISLIYNLFFLDAGKNKQLHDVALGVVSGIMGIILMVNTVQFATGIIFDTRSILMGTIGLFFGPTPVLIAAVMISAYRIFLGGSGAIMGITVTFVTAGFGLFCNRKYLKKMLTKESNVWIKFYGFGLILHVLMLLCAFALPADRVFPVMSAIALPVLSFYPIGTVLVCLVIYKGLINKRTERSLIDSEARFRTIFEQAPVGITVGKEWKTFYINSTFEKILGRTMEEILAIGWGKLTHPDDLAKEYELYQQFREGKISQYRMNKRYFKPDGSIVWVQMFLTALTIKDQPAVDFVCMAQDVTELVEAEFNLKKSEAEYRSLYLEYHNRQQLLLALLNSIPDLIFYKDTNSVYLGCNKAFAEYIGASESEIVGMTDHSLFTPEMGDYIREIDIALMQERSELRNEIESTYPDGKKVILETVNTPYYDSDGNILGLIGISRDITERIQREREVRFLHYHDVLTGVYNRAFIEEEITRIDTAENLPLSVIVGDINGLKIINDAFGHQKGDRLLAEIARILRECTRAQDIIARTGGDEFQILLPNTDEPTASAIVDRIKTACEHYATSSEKDVYYTSISLGYATKTSAEENLSSILKTAEDFMYRKKLLEHKSLHSSLLSSIKSTMYEKSNETEEHAERMTNHVRSLGRALGLDEKSILELELISTLHDIGKIGIDSDILLKPEPLTDEEWTEIRKHPEIGYRITQSIPELSNISEYILCHHECWDGHGYPEGLQGEKIPLLSRIISIVDAYDAMTEDRAYRKAMSHEDAVAELRRNAGTQFDPTITEIFIEKCFET